MEDRVRQDFTNCCNETGQMRRKRKKREKFLKETSNQLLDLGERGELSEAERRLALAELSRVARESAGILSFVPVLISILALTVGVVYETGSMSPAYWASVLIVVLAIGWVLAIHLPSRPNAKSAAADILRSRASSETSVESAVPNQTPSNVDGEANEE